MAHEGRHCVTVRRARGGVMGAELEACNLASVKDFPGLEQLKFGCRA